MEEDEKSGDSGRIADIFLALLCNLDWRRCHSALSLLAADFTVDVYIGGRRNKIFARQRPIKKTFFQKAHNRRKCFISGGAVHSARLRFLDVNFHIAQAKIPARTNGGQGLRRRRTRKYETFAKY